MAEGSDLSSSIIFSSDEVVDYPCGFCKDNGRNSESSSCCNTCNKQMCDSCTAAHYTLYKKHAVLGKNDVDKWVVHTPSSSSAADSPDGEHVYRVAKMMKMKYLSCYITGICVLPDGNTVISDYGNINLKLLNENYGVKHHLKLPALPVSLCHVAGNKVAVILRTVGIQKLRNKSRYTREIQYINILRDDIMMMDKIQLDHECVGLAHRNGQLYVAAGDGGGLYVNKMDGSNTRQLYTGSVRDVAVNQEDGRIYLAASSAGLVVLNTDGQVLSTLQDEDFHLPNALAIASNNTVFVVGSDSNTVIQVDRDGRNKKGALVTIDRGELLCEHSLCVNYQTNEVITGLYGGIYVIQLK